jgi:uncharacterized membrane protein YfcA
MLTALMASLADGRRGPSEPRRAAAVLVAVAVGALVGAVLLSRLPLLTPTVSAGILGVVTIIAAGRSRAGRGPAAV